MNMPLCVHGYPLRDVGASRYLETFPDFTQIFHNDFKENPQKNLVKYRMADRMIDQTIFKGLTACPLF